MKSATRKPQQQPKSQIEQQNGTLENISKQCNATEGMENLDMFGLQMTCRVQCDTRSRERPDADSAHSWISRRHTLQVPASPSWASCWETRSTTFLAWFGSVECSGGAGLMGIDLKATCLGSGGCVRPRWERACSLMEQVHPTTTH